SATEYANMAVFNSSGARTRFWNRGSGGSDNQAVAAINDGQWHLLTWVVTPTGSTLYLDGIAIDTEAVAYSTLANADSLDIGRLGRSSPTDFFNGLIDDVRIYDEALSAAQVGEIYAAFTAVPEPATAGLLVLGAMGLIRRR